MFICITISKSNQYETLKTKNDISGFVPVLTNTLGVGSLDQLYLLYLCHMTYSGMMS